MKLCVSPTPAPSHMVPEHRVSLRGSSVDSAAQGIPGGLSHVVSFRGTIENATTPSCNSPRIQLIFPATRVCCMTRRDKLIQRFLSFPRDFDWQELVTMLNSFGYEQVSGGKSAGSRVKFLHPTLPPISLHKPHPTSIL